MFYVERLQIVLAFFVSEYYCLFFYFLCLCSTWNVGLSAEFNKQYIDIGW